jgi:hypothetical protein
MVHLGPITGLFIDGKDMTDHVRSVSFTGVNATDATPACTWDTLVDAYNRITRDALAEPAPGQPRVIDQDGNPVRPPIGRLRNLGSA